MGVPIFLKKDNSPNLNNLQASIISCQYNEEENLYCLIQHICDQKDSELELIIIDDQSTDQSLNLARAYKNNKKLDIKVFENTLKKGKKHAQKVGFKKARHNNLLLTDIDCIPASDLWAKKND